MNEEESQWMHIADVMSALMMIFMFIAVAFLYQILNEKEIYKVKLNKALHKEFDKDLKRYNAVITEDNIFRFNAPFLMGDDTLPLSFANVLHEFFPRYISLLASKPFKKEIDEIRVEGHTSKGWGDLDEKEAYLYNIQLSQKRASKVLAYCYHIVDPIIDTNIKWLQQKLRANGISSSKPIYANKTLKSIDANRSRRVEFRVMVKEHKDGSL